MKEGSNLRSSVNSISTHSQYQIETTFSFHHIMKFVYKALNFTSKFM